jgi:hypothetical protein
MENQDEDYDHDRLACDQTGNNLLLHEAGKKWELRYYITGKRRENCFMF